MSEIQPAWDYLHKHGVMTLLDVREKGFSEVSPAYVVSILAALPGVSHGKERRGDGGLPVVVDSSGRKNACKELAPSIYTDHQGYRTQEYRQDISPKDKLHGPCPAHHRIEKYGVATPEQQESEQRRIIVRDPGEGYASDHYRY